MKSRERPRLTNSAMRARRSYGIHELKLAIVSTWRYTVAIGCAMDDLEYATFDIRLMIALGGAVVLIVGGAVAFLIAMLW